MHVYVMTISSEGDEPSIHGIYEHLLAAMTSVRNLADLRGDMWVKIQWEEGETGDPDSPTQYWSTEIERYRYSIMRMIVQ